MHVGSLVQFDITIDGQLAGRIVFELFDNIAPKTARKFRELATGQHGFGYKGSRFTWTAPKEIIVVGENQTSKRFIHGNTFPVDNLLFKHDAPGVLSTVMSSNQVTHESDFFITTVALPQRDGVNVAFGKVTAGIDIVYWINGLNRTFGMPSKPVIIVDCGVISLLAKSTLREKIELIPRGRNKKFRLTRVSFSGKKRFGVSEAVESRGGKEKRALDTVQQLLAFPDEATSEDDRFSLADLMVSLCEGSKSYPTCPTLNGVVQTDESQMLEPTKKSDMYSITCVMYEVLTGCIPYHEVLRDAMVILKVMSGAQPSKPSSFDGSEWTNEIWDVMEQCLEQRLPM
ncbi:Peptidyl-prolyl cis-trans isomerase A2 [Leucoagaricus sp. SymC.cos]|nr:Peptidyl-prolyl cis-trans isomerase A2 [Leucoagaricus sp. SymC.cos]